MLKSAGFANRNQPLGTQESQPPAQATVSPLENAFIFAPGGTVELRLISEKNQTVNFYPVTGRNSLTFKLSNAVVLKTVLVRLFLEVLKSLAVIAAMSKLNVMKF